MRNQRRCFCLATSVTCLAATCAAFVVFPGGVSRVSAEQSAPAAQAATKPYDLTFSTYLGGSGGDLLRDMTADAQGNVYVAGIAGSADFPRTPGTLPGQSHRGGGTVAKFSPAGQLTWSRVVGGRARETDYLYSVKVNSAGSVFVAGRMAPGFPATPEAPHVNTFSNDMPTTPDAFCATPGKSWIGKFSAAGSKLIFGTYTGVTTGTPFARTHNVAVDSRGNTFIAACTDKTWQVTPGAFQTKFGGGRQDFGVLKLSPTGALLAATFLGGNGHEINGPDQIVLDVEGNVVVAGSSSSIDYPVTANALQTRNAGASGQFPFDGVASILSNDLSTLLYSTYIGGTSDEMARGCCVGRDGTLYVGGVTTSRGFPTKNAWQEKYGGDPGFGSIPSGGRWPAGWGNGDCWVTKFVRPGDRAEK